MKPNISFLVLKIYVSLFLFFSLIQLLLSSFSPFTLIAWLAGFSIYSGLLFKRKLSWYFAFILNGVGFVVALFLLFVPGSKIGTATTVITTFTFIFLLYVNRDLYFLPKKK